MSDKQILIADIGGTNARFAIATETGRFFDRKITYQCSEYYLIESAIDAYIKETGLTEFSSFCFAVAGPIQNQTVDFTNNHWFADMPALKTRYSLLDGRLLNDFEAISYSLPVLGNQQIIPIGSNEWSSNINPNFTLGVLGPGSGLGVGGVIQRDSNIYSLVNEGGHCGFAPETGYQIDILKALSQKFTRVTNERLLSGPGIKNLYQAICEIEGLTADNIDAKEIGIRLAKDTEANKTDSVYIKTLNLFFEILGQVAGDLALIQSSFDGIFVAGGICQRYPEFMKNSAFRTGFERKGSHAHLLEKTPTWLITENNPGLIGASVYSNNVLK